VLEASDGNRFLAFAALPENPAGAKVLIYPDVRGLHQFYKELALRFAETGFTALALDYFGRTAGLSTRDDSFEFMPHVQQLQLETFTLDVQASLDHLKGIGGEGGKIFVVGFCMGGSLALITGTNPDLGFTGLIPFYAGMSRNFGGRGTVLDHAHNVIYPVLGLFGGNDPGIPQNNIDQLGELLNKAGIENEIVVYPGAPHSFFDRRATDYANESEDSWKRILSFIRSH
jgi:carboxymethylenebutenolidase